MTTSPPEWAREFVTQARVGRLATASAEAVPHVIPICFVLLGESVYSVVDEKPKSGRRLQRLRNVDQTGTSALVVDHYDDDWTQLAWVLMRGPTRVITAPADVLQALREKYPQYRSMSLEDAEMVELTVAKWTSWRFSPKE